MAQKPRFLTWQDVLGRAELRQIRGICFRAADLQRGVPEVRLWVERGCAAAGLALTKASADSPSLVHGHEATARLVTANETLPALLDGVHSHILPLPVDKVCT
jgi:hypothetical protein